MIGCYDFCGHYEWTFNWLDREGGHGLVRAFRDEAINQDRQIHARELILKEGFEGMAKYWGHTLLEESPELGFKITKKEDVFRVDMHDCPSKGFLLKNDLEQYRDYCYHCMGWIGPLMKEAGFTIDHEHNHCGQCWWDIRKQGEPDADVSVGATSGDADVRLREEWTQDAAKVDAYRKSNDPDVKHTPNS